MGVTAIEYRRTEIHFFAPTCRLGRLSIISNKSQIVMTRTHTQKKLIWGRLKLFQITATLLLLIIESKTSFVVVAAVQLNSLSQTPRTHFSSHHNIDVPCLDLLPLSVAWPVSWLDLSHVDRLESLFSLVPAALCVLVRVGLALPSSVVLVVALYLSICGMPGGSWRRCTPKIKRTNDGQK